MSEYPSALNSSITMQLQSVGSLTGRPNQEALQNPLEVVRSIPSSPQSARQTRIALHISERTLQV